MTAIKSWTIQCDGCGESDGHDLGADTAAEQRRRVKNNGWHVNQPGGRDICDACWMEGVR